MLKDKKATKKTEFPFISEINHLLRCKVASWKWDEEENRKRNAWCTGTYWSGLEMLLQEPPLVPVVLIIHQVLLHDLIVLVKEQVADGTGGCVLQVVHWRQRKQEQEISKPLTTHPPLNNTFKKKKITNKPLLHRPSFGIPAKTKEIFPGWKGHR